MSNIDKIYEILDILKQMYPNAKCELNYTNLYELSVAVSLSAQTTDKAVNAVTKSLFSKYPDIYALNGASIEDLEELIRPLGLYHVKATNLLKMAFDVVEKFNGVIPSRYDDLIKLNGIGNKTANVILVEYFHIPRFPVDTHIDRVSKRLGLVPKEKNVLDVEKALSCAINECDYHKAHHLLLFFGRYHCLSKKPLCMNCPLIKYCVYNK